MYRNDPDSASLQGWIQPPPQDFGNEIYPGLGDPFGGPPALVNPVVVPQKTKAKSGMLGNLGEWKQMLDRMGGIEGVMGTMGKIQKFVSTMQQMAPLLRLFIGKGGGAATAAGFTRKSAAGHRGKTRRRRITAGRHPRAGTGARRPGQKPPNRRR